MLFIHTAERGHLSDGEEGIAHIFMDHRNFSRLTLKALIDLQSAFS